MRIVLITGASRGLGLALAKEFIAAGDRVYGLTRTRKHWPAALRAVERKENLILCQGDITREADIKKFIALVYRREKRIDILVNNAGYGGPLARLEKLTLREFQKVMSSNLEAVFLAAKHALPYLRKQKKGLILNISSMAGMRGVPRIAAYSAAKFGVAALTECLAKENEDAGLRVFTICPGGMNTKMRADLFGKEDAAKQQSAEFVAEKIMRVVEGDIPLNTGAAVIIRHGKITGIKEMPGQ